MAEGDEGVAEAVANLGNETAALVRRQIDAAAAEALTKLKSGLPAASLLLGAAVAGTFSAAAAYRWTIKLLEKKLPPASAAWVATVIYGSVAGYATLVAGKRLRQLPLPMPVETTEQTAAAVRDVTSHLTPADSRN